MSELAEQIGQTFSQKSFTYLKAASFFASQTENELCNVFHHVVDALKHTSLRQIPGFLIHLEYSNEQGLKFEIKFEEFLNARIFSFVSRWVSWNYACVFTAVIEFQKYVRIQVKYIVKHLV